MVFGNGVKNIQAAAYNGARTVYQICSCPALYRNKHPFNLHPLSILCSDVKQIDFFYLIKIFRFQTRFLLANHRKNFILYVYLKNKSRPNVYTLVLYYYNVSYNGTIFDNHSTFQWIETTPMSGERLHAGSVQILEGGKNF